MTEGDVGVLSEEQKAEYEAWRTFCKEFEDAAGIGIDQDRCRGMVSIVKLWGERLVALRVKMPDTQERGLNMAVGDWEDLCRSRTRREGA